MMSPPILRATIAAAIKRAKRDGRDIDRLRLKRETGLTDRAGLARFEALVSEITMELQLCGGPDSAAEGGQDGGAGPTPGVAPGPFAPATAKGRARR
jgi:hypothetical protein